MKTIFQRVQEIYDQGKTAVLATVVESMGSTPRKPRARMIIYPDGSIEGSVGGGSVEKHIVQEALKLVKEGESRLIHIDLQENKPDSVGGVCGGEMSIFIETVGTSSRLLILGGGHIGRALARMSRELDLRVLVYDDREEYTKPNDFPPDTEIHCGPFEKAMEILQPTHRDYIAIVTYTHTIDEMLVKNALDTPAGYIGMIGSRTKSKRIKDNLLKGGCSQEQVKRVRAPIGLPIGAHTPAEIAISILAEIVQVMNQKQSRTQRKEKTQIP